MIREQTIYTCDLCKHHDVRLGAEGPPNHWWIMSIQRGFAGATIGRQDTTVHDLCHECARKLDKVVREGWPEVES